MKREIRVCWNTKPLHLSWYRVITWWVEREQAREDLMRMEACGGRGWRP